MSSHLAEVADGAAVGVGQLAVAHLQCGEGQPEWISGMRAAGRALEESSCDGAHAGRTMSTTEHKRKGTADRPSGP